MSLETLAQLSPGWAILIFIVSIYLRHEVKTRNGGTREQKTLDLIVKLLRELRLAVDRQPAGYLDVVKEAYPVEDEKRARERMQRIDERVKDIRDLLQESR